MNSDEANVVPSSNSTTGLRSHDFILILAVPLVIVAFSLNTKSLWGDEMFSLDFANQNLGGLLSSVAADCHPPLYFILLKGWIDIWGTSELALRAFQGVQGSLLLLLALLLFRKLLPNHRYHPFWLLLITSSELWLFMPMLRYYTLAAVLAIFSSLVFLHASEAKKRNAILLLGASYVLLLYTDYQASVVAAFHLAYAWFKDRSFCAKLLLIDLGAAILFSPWFVVTLNQIQSLFSWSWEADLNSSPYAVPIKVSYTLYAFVLGETTYPFEMLAIGVSLLIVVALIALHSGIRHAFADAAAMYSFGLVIIGIVFTAVLTTFISTHTSFIYTPSRTFFGLTFLFLVFGAIYSWSNKPFPKYLLISAFLAANVYGISNWILNRHFLVPSYATPWKEMLAEIEGNSGVILIDESAGYKYYRGILPGTYPTLCIADSVQDLYKSQIRPLYVFLIMMGRESTEPEELKKVVVDHIRTKGVKLFEKKFLPLEQDYRFIKSKIIGRDAYDAKYTLLKYELPTLPVYD